MALRLKTEHFQNSEFPKTQTNFTKTQQNFYQNSDFRKLIKSLFKLRYCIIYVNCIFWCNILSVPKTSIVHLLQITINFALTSACFVKSQKISPKLRKFRQNSENFLQNSADFHQNSVNFGQNSGFRKLN